MLRPLLCLLLIWVQGACTSIPTAQNRLDHAQLLASKQGWHGFNLVAGNFLFKAFEPLELKSERRLTVYIEGDGLSWISPSSPSPDPTPIDPLSLKLAMRQPQGEAVYLARPCQYLKAANPACVKRLWTRDRFSEQVIQSTTLAVDELKKRYGASELVLVGYSGGGAVATLLAARRSDIAQLITVAGNLDHQAWTAFHRISPLKGSLNPVDFLRELGEIPQVHVVGQEDRVVPPQIAERFVARLHHSQAVDFRVLPDFDHHCCWADAWPKIWREAQLNLRRQ